MTLEKGQSGEPARTNASCRKEEDAPGFLEQAGIDPSVLASAREQAAQKNTHISHVLCEQGILTRNNYVRQLAGHYGLSCACAPLELAGF